jgi:molecular chaperone DnaK
MPHRGTKRAGQGRADGTVTSKRVEFVEGRQFQSHGIDGVMKISRWQLRSGSAHDGGEFVQCRCGSHQGSTVVGDRNHANQGVMPNLIIGHDFGAQVGGHRVTGCLGWVGSDGHDQQRTRRERSQASQGLGRLLRGEVDHHHVGGIDRLQALADLNTDECAQINQQRGRVRNDRDPERRDNAFLDTSNVRSRSQPSTAGHRQHVEGSASSTGSDHAARLGGAPLGCDAVRQNHLSAEQLGGRKRVGQCSCKINDRVVALFRKKRERTADHCGELGGDVGPHRANRCDGAAINITPHPGKGGRRDRRLAGEHFVEHRSGTEHIDPMVDKRSRSGLLGGHVRRSASGLGESRRGGQILGQTKVTEDHLLITQFGASSLRCKALMRANRSEQHVAGLHVTMHHPEGVHDGKALTDLDGEAHRLLDRHWCAGGRVILNAVVEGASVGPRHHEVRTAIGHLVHVVNTHHTVVVDTTQNLGLFDETSSHIGMLRPVIGQDFYRNLGVENLVIRKPHGGKTARTERSTRQVLADAHRTVHPAIQAETWSAASEPGGILRNNLATLVVEPKVTTHEIFPNNQFPEQTGQESPFDALVGSAEMASGMVGSSPGTWTLAVDFGTSFTVAAVRPAGRSPEVIEIGGDRRVPSVIFVDEDGSIRVGRAAEDLAASRPGRAVRAPKRRLGEPAPVVLGGKPFQVVDLVAALLRYVYDEAVRHQGSAPGSIRLTHPASWSRPRMARLLEAAAKAGLTNVALISEPVAAAVAYAADVEVADGSHVAVYDLGGGTFDMTLLRFANGAFSIVGRPGGDVNLGGELFDELLVNLVGERLDPDVWGEMQVSDEQAWQQAAAALRTECRRAKEALSTNSYADLVLPLPSGMTSQRITRDDLETLVRPYIDESVRLLVQGVTDAGVDPQSLTAVYLVGGASRMPLVESSVTEALPNVPVSRRGDPKTAVAVGATQAEISASVLDMQAGPTRTTLESDGGRRLGLPDTPPSPGSFDRATVGGSAELPTVPPPPIPQAGTVIEPPSVVASNLSPPQQPPQPFGQPQPQYGQPAAPPQQFGQPQYGQPASAPPTVAPKTKTPLIAAGVAAGVLLFGGIGFAATRGGDSKAAVTTSPPATAPSGGGGPITAGSTSSSSVATITLKPTTPISAETTPPTTKQVPPTASTVPPTVKPTPPAGSGDRALNVEQADATLLTLDEVSSAAGGTGWTQGVWSPGGDLCGVKTPDAILDRHSVAVRNEVAGADIGVIVTTSTLTYASLSDLNENYSSLKRISNDCPDPTLSENGRTGTIKFIPAEEISIPNLDRAMLLGLTAQVDGVSIPNQILLVLATRGRSSFVIQYQVNGRAGINEDAVALKNLYVALADKFVKALP